MSKELYQWISCQIGARENYCIPRTLHKHDQLTHLITDSWVKPQSILNLLPQNILTNLRERYDPDLENASVHSFNTALIQFELTQKLQKKTGWNKVIARNQWFQKRAINTLKSIADNFTNPPILFSYSYAALELFRFAKKQGWYTVLGQIDPGLWEEKIVIQEYEKYPKYRGNWEPAPDEYWQNWQEECKIADAIVVNSHWSRQLLEKTGIDCQKIHIIPLAYTRPETANKFIRTYPESFSQERPLRVLFLGQVILRKGIAAVLDAVQLLEGYPVEFWIVGSQQIEIPTYLKTHPQIHWVDHINRSETAQYYQMTDVFLFPTLSDGFGLTQLEAQAWKLPIITSCYCGEVVIDGVNGWILEKVTGESITQCLLDLVANSINISRCQQNSLCNNENTDFQLYHRLQNLVNSLVI